MNRGSLLRGRGRSIEDEITEPRPDMNTKVAAFTVSEKSSNTHLNRKYGVILHL